MNIEFFFGIQECSRIQKDSEYRIRSFRKNLFWESEEKEKQFE